jgi:ribosomal protein S18 acetylase RimI-like enzyme
MLGEATKNAKVFEQVVPAWPTLLQTLSHEASTVATMTIAFATDPVARWFYPKPADYFRWFPAFVRAFAGRAFADRTELVTSNYSGVALWLRPGAEIDENGLTKLVADSLPAERHDEIFELFEKMGNGHPKEDHWYLPMIGVDSVRQSLGIGTGLMKIALERSDREGLPAYLESSNPRNISLYERCGFEAVGEIRVAGSPPLIPMLRTPRR